MNIVNYLEKRWGTKVHQHRTKSKKYESNTWKRILNISASLLEHILITVTKAFSALASRDSEK